MQEKNKLKEIRLNCGLSQSKLAEKSCVGIRTIQSYEAGMRDLNKASGETLYNLSKALNCSMEDLISIR